MKPYCLPSITAHPRPEKLSGRSPLPRRVLCRLGLALILSGGVAGTATAAATATAPDQVPWVQAWEAREARAKGLPNADEAPGLQPAPPPAGTPFVRPSDETLAQLHRELDDLKARLAELPKDEFGQPPADAAVYAEIVELQLKIDSWPPIGLDQSCFTALRWGRAVAAGIKADPNFMQTVRHLAPVAYRSPVDRAAQPYMLLLPPDFDPARTKPWRLIVTLHGYYRWTHPLGTLLGAVNRTGDVHADAITVLPFGRANSGYTWAGETDVWDVIADVKKRYHIDESQIVLSGFSMGGGGTVTLGLTHPGPFAACAALGAATFSTEPAPKAGELPAGPQRFAPLSDEEIGKRVRGIYVGPGVAENGLGMPWMLGVGGDDGLRRSVDAIAKSFETAGVKYSLFIVANTGHRGDILAAQPHYVPYLMAHRRDPEPKDVTFATVNLRSADRAWVHVEGLTAHYAKSIIHAVADPAKGTLAVTTDGIERFSLTPSGKLAPRAGTIVTVDGETFAAPVAGLAFEKAGGKWRPAAGPVAPLSKHPGLQGPVGDAFTRGFLCVRPTGVPWNAAANAHALALLDGVRTMWRTRMFGELPVKDDREVTAEDRAKFDLILFGDPGSNSLIAETLAAKLPWSVPLTWTQDAVGLGSHKFPAASHLPTLVYPSPFSSEHYLVLNGAPANRSRGGGSRGRPEDAVPGIIPDVLGDFAIFTVPDKASTDTAGKSVYGGFFNEQWQVSRAEQGQPCPQRRNKFPQLLNNKL